MLWLREVDGGELLQDILRKCWLRSVTQIILSTSSCQWQRLVRQPECLRHEAKNNGNINWDEEAISFRYAN